LCFLPFMIEKKFHITYTYIQTYKTDYVYFDLGILIFSNHKNDCLQHSTNFRCREKKKICQGFESEVSKIQKYFSFIRL
jgi:hypothetical protein